MATRKPLVVVNGYVAELADGDQLPQPWAYYKDHWSAEPTLQATVAAGDVWAYQLDGVTRYRLVPEPYNPVMDAFYSTFAGGALSGLIAARG